MWRDRRRLRCKQVWKLSGGRTKEERRKGTKEGPEKSSVKGGKEEGKEGRSGKK